MRIFDLPDPPTLPGPEFQLGEEKFQCQPTLPAGSLNNLFTGVTNSDPGLKATALIRMIQSALDADGRIRFDALIYSTTSYVPLELLQDVAEWLAEEYTSRPSLPSSGSSAGSTPMPATPGDGSSATASD